MGLRTEVREPAVHHDAKLHQMPWECTECTDGERWGSVVYYVLHSEYHNTTNIELIHQQFMHIHGLRACTAVYCLRYTPLVMPTAHVSPVPTHIQSRP